MAVCSHACPAIDTAPFTQVEHCYQRPDLFAPSRQTPRQTRRELMTSRAERERGHGDVDTQSAAPSPGYNAQLQQRKLTKTKRKILPQSMHGPVLFLYPHQQTGHCLNVVRPLCFHGGLTGVWEADKCAGHVTREDVVNSGPTLLIPRKKLVK